MMIRMIRAERMKLKHSPVWLAFLLLPVLSAVMGTFNYVQNTSILRKEWYSLWTQHTLFDCYFFLPAVIGVYCSYLLRLEHTNHNWNMVMTAPVLIRTIYPAKLLAAFAMVLLTQGWTGILFVISGKLCGLRSAVPQELPVWLLLGAVGGMVVCALQLCISLVIRSFAVPVGIAVAGGVFGLMASAKGLGVWFPYSLISLGMQSGNPDAPMQCGSGQFALNSIVYLLICSTFAALWLKKRDVITG